MNTLDSLSGQVNTSLVKSPVLRAEDPAHVPSATKAHAQAYVTGLAALIQDAETNAARGCGQSDVLYDELVQAAYASILDRAPETERAETEAALRQRGFEPDLVLNQAGEGECSLTGIDVDCCPCGHHFEE